MTHLRFSILALAAIAAAPTAALGAPPGYVRVQTAFLPAPAGVQSGSQVDCPAGTVPLGGGAGFAGGLPDFGMNLNTSAPNGSAGWRARFNNGTARDGRFVVRVICANPPRRYTTVFAAVDNPAGTQVTATATCPGRRVLLGGGTLSTSSLPAAAITSAWPSSSKTFTGVMFNGTAGNERLDVFAICGRRPRGYEIVSATSSGVGPADFVGGVQCPLGKTILSGGVEIANPRREVTLGASFQDSGEQWLAEVLGNTPTLVQNTLYAVCAR